LFSTIDVGLKIKLKRFVDNEQCFYLKHEDSLKQAMINYKNNEFSLSLDLSNATDAIPAELQKEALRHVFSPAIGES